MNIVGSKSAPYLFKEFYKYYESKNVQTLFQSSINNMESKILHIFKNFYKYERKIFHATNVLRQFFFQSFMLSQKLIESAKPQSLLIMSYNKMPMTKSFAHNNFCKK
jgi:hypothetical protein